MFSAESLAPQSGGHAGVGVPGKCTSECPGGEAQGDVGVTLKDLGKAIGPLK